MKQLFSIDCAKFRRAKTKLNHFKFDLIVLDVMMPGQSGYELTKEII